MPADDRHACVFAVRNWGRAKLGREILDAHALFIHAVVVPADDVVVDVIHDIDE